MEALTAGEVAARLGIKTGMVRRYALALEAVTGVSVPVDPVRGRLYPPGVFELLEAARAHLLAGARAGGPAPAGPPGDPTPPPDSLEWVVEAAASIGTALLRRGVLRCGLRAYRDDCVLSAVFIPRAYTKTAPHNSSSRAGRFSWRVRLSNVGGEMTAGPWGAWLAMGSARSLALKGRNSSAQGKRSAALWRRPQYDSEA